MKALEKIKDMIDFCDATGCHRALYESLKAVETELEALQSRSCEGCKYCTNVFSYTYPLCTKDEQYPFQIHNKEVLFCNRYEAKE